MVEVRIPKAATASRITYNFVAGENITANQIVRLSDEEEETVLIAATDAPRLILGVALNDALIGGIVEVCIYGVAEVVAGEELFPGDVIGLGATPGRAYEGGAVSSGPGSAHTHAESLTVEAAVGAVAVMGYLLNLYTKYCAPTSGAEATEAFSAIATLDTVDVSESDHSHAVGGTIDNEYSHNHSVFPGQAIGKAIEYATAGNSIKILVCLL